MSIYETGAALPGDRVRLFRTRGFDGKVVTRVWTVPGLDDQGLRDDLVALSAAIDGLRHHLRTLGPEVVARPALTPALVETRDE